MRIWPGHHVFLLILVFPFVSNPMIGADYQRINFSVYNPANVELPLNCSLHDRLHRQYGQVFKDRFYQWFILHSGWNDLRISLNAVRTAQGWLRNGHA